MRTIAIINQKGGCGKTTVSINLASALAVRGHRTLLVDMDPQSHCAVGLAVPEEQIEQSIYDILVSHSRGEAIRLTEIMWKISENFELAPASIDLAAFEQQMAGLIDSEMCLKKVLDSVKRNYDYVIIDCPPSVGLLTFNAIRASTDIIVPVETGYFSLHGLSKQLATLNVLCDQCGQDINVMVLASMYDIRTKMGREILSELRKHFSDRMFKSVINFNTKLKEAASLGQPVSEYDPASKGFKDFQEFAEELVSTDAHSQRAQAVEALQSKLDAISASADELLSSVEPLDNETKAEIARTDLVASGEIMVEPAPPIIVKVPVIEETVVEKEIVAEEKPATVELVAEAAPDQKAKPQTVAKTIDQKIADFYGVRQVDDAVMFVSLYPRAESVQIAGDFNNWQPGKLQMEKMTEKGLWQIKLPLAKGKYRYRLVVDGHWQQDPYNETTEMNPFGECNSVLEVH
ncbi:MAG: AAA family ATPase [Phycisphaerae bacterium]|nr:AAA family ATPase [Phycisphaerae bacterium]